MKSIAVTYLIPACAALCIVALLVVTQTTGSRSGQKEPPAGQAAETLVELEELTEGQTVEATGVLWRSHLGESPLRPEQPDLRGRYYIKRCSLDYVFLASGALDQLEEGTKVWVRGIVRYATYEDELRYRHCYVVVSEFQEREGALQDVSTSFKKAGPKGRGEEGVYLIEHIRPGMSRDQVRELLGEPSSRGSSFPNEGWWYETDFSAAISVRFRFYKVVSVQGGRDYVPGP